MARNGNGFCGSDTELEEAEVLLSHMDDEQYSFCDTQYSD